jgi:molecular chaperone GrpE
MSTPTTDQDPSLGANAADDRATGSDHPPLGETGDESLAQLQTDLDRFRDLALRSQADFENFRKRAAREKDEALKYANSAMLERLIPILDNFDLGLQAARNSEENSPILAGMEMVAKQLHDFLQQHGVEPVPAEGAKFDPNLHEAVAQEASAKVPEGHVIRQLRKGFKLKDRLLRPATVVVSKGAP